MGEPFTKTVPTDGWYWWKMHLEDDPEIVRVAIPYIDGTLRMRRPGRVQWLSPKGFFGPRIPSPESLASPGTEKEGENP